MGELKFEDFSELASNKKLSPYEKIGFPDSYRQGFDKIIGEDIFNKLQVEKGATILDVGCGCSPLVNEIIAQAKSRETELILVDSKEMLSNISGDTNKVKMVEGMFPAIPELFEQYQSKVDYIICYSVFHYVFIQGNYLNFIHRSIELLKPGGAMLIGDIPNITKRERLLNSEEGREFVKEYDTQSGDTSHENVSEKMDDSIVFSILQRMRSFGVESYLLPQNKNLPMSNRREDILLVKR